MMYENNRNGIIEEYTDKLAAEAAGGMSESYDRLQKHFIRGLVSDIVDRVAEDPSKFVIEDPADVDKLERVKSILENHAPVTEEFRLGEIEKVLNK